MKLKYKLPLVLFFAFVAIIAVTFTISLSNTAKLRQASEYEMGRSMAEAKAEIMKGFLEIKIAELRALDKDLHVMMRQSDKEKEAAIGQLMTAFFDQRSVSDVYVTFERGAYFSADSTKPGFYYNVDVFRSEKGTIEMSVSKSEPVAEDDDWYLGPKNTMKPYLTEPYGWTYPGETRERKMISVCVPIIVDGNFIGAAGVDMELTLLQGEIFGKMADESMGAYAILVSHEGLRAVHPREDMLLVDIAHDLDEAEGQVLKDAIQKGEYRRLLHKSQLTGELSLMSYVPMQPAGIDLPWSLGYVISMATLHAEGKKIRNSTIMMGFICAAAWGIFLLIFMSAIFGNITRTVETLSQMTAGGGDLTIRLLERGKDEFGMMAKGLNSLIDKLHSTIKTTQKEAKNLSGTSASLFGLSENLLNSSETTLNQSTSVSRESEDTSANVAEIAGEAERASATATELSATAGQMGGSMNAMVEAVGQMHESFTRITADTRESKAVAGLATEKVADTMGVMDALGLSAKEIWQLTGVIKSIAKKTNLIALNATVEAARAGEAGKGFAVVASEVKQLANQSADNADDITQRIENIQNGTTAAIDSIKGISAIITKISESVNSIAESIERQIKVSDDLAAAAKNTNADAQRVVQSVGDVANFIQITAKRTSDAAEGAKNVSDSIGVIHGNAEKTNACSTELKTAANSLKVMAEGLDAIVSKFKT